MSSVLTLLEHVQGVLAGAKQRDATLVMCEQHVALGVAALRRHSTGEQIAAIDETTHAPTQGTQTSVEAPTQGTQTCVEARAAGTQVGATVADAEAQANPCITSRGSQVCRCPHPTNTLERKHLFCDRAAAAVSSDAHIWTRLRRPRRLRPPARARRPAPRNLSLGDGRGKAAKILSRL